MQIVIKWNDPLDIVKGWGLGVTNCARKSMISLKYSGNYRSVGWLRPEYMKT